mgnify:CR=1
MKTIIDYIIILKLLPFAIVLISVSSIVSLLHDNIDNVIKQII